MTEPYIRTTRDATELFPFMCFGGLGKMKLDTDKLSAALEKKDVDKSVTYQEVLAL